MTDLLPTRLQSKGIAGARRSQSRDRRKDDSCGFEEADICACKGAQGCTEQVIPKRRAPPFGGAFVAISPGSAGTR